MSEPMKMTPEETEKRLRKVESMCICKGCPTYKTLQKEDDNIAYCFPTRGKSRKIAEEKGLSEDYIIPPMEEQDVFIREATAIAMKAIEEGVARVKRSRNEIYEHSKAIIERARKQTSMLMKENFIRPPPKV